MADTTCGHCGRLTHMAELTPPIVKSNQALQITDQAFACDACKRVSIRCIYAGLTSPGISEVWYPRHGEKLDFPDVPEHIAAAATEASFCLGVKAYRGAGALARAVIEATAKDKKAEGRNLEIRIEALKKMELIRTHTAEQAHEVRHFGNDMAHGDFVEQVTKDEAEEVVALMAEILDEVYQSPARLKRRREARSRSTMVNPGARKEQRPPRGTPAGVAVDAGQGPKARRKAPLSGPPRAHAKAQRAHLLVGRRPRERQTATVAAWDRPGRAEGPR